MKNVLDKFFNSDNTILALTVGDLIFGLMMCFYLVSSDSPITNVFLFLIHPISALFLYVSYKNHEKNVMKGLMGSLMTSAITVQLMQMNSANNADRLTVILSWIYLFVLVAVTVNHFLINSTHHSSPVKIKVNQILSLLLLIIDVASNTYTVINRGSFDIIVLIGALSFTLITFCFVGILVCIESKLDTSRIKREEKGWREEA